MDHEHHQWLADVNKSIVDSYERDQDMARQPKNIQRTGHRVESRWDEVLSDWHEEAASWPDEPWDGSSI